MNLKSRKTIMIVVALLVAVLGFAKEDFALVGDPGAAVAAIGVALLYVFGEAKLDAKRIKEAFIQSGKWKDPKFYMALIAVVLPVFGEQLGIELPVETIQGAIALILPILFGLIFKKKTPA